MRTAKKIRYNEDGNNRHGSYNHQSLNQRKAFSHKTEYVISGEIQQEKIYTPIGLVKKLGVIFYLAPPAGSEIPRDAVCRMSRASCASSCWIRFLRAAVLEDATRFTLGIMTLVTPALGVALANTGGEYERPEPTMWITSLKMQQYLANKKARYG